MRISCRIALWALVTTVAGCGASGPRDDFPGRLKGGCSSRDDCRALVTEARHRLLDCDRYLVGNNLARDRYHLCSYEKGDYCAALERTLDWGIRAHVRGTTSGPTLTEPFLLPGPARAEEPATTAADRFVARLSPFARQARATYADARRRFLAGLGPEESLYLMVVVRDDRGFFELAYVKVEHIEGTRAFGHVASNIVLVRGYARWGRIRVDEEELVDWMIAKPDGTAEGHIIGKYLDVTI
jgi:hypothetical protein